MRFERNTYPQSGGHCLFQDLISPVLVECGTVRQNELETGRVVS